MTALMMARRVLQRWAELYAHLQNECGEVVSRKLDYNLPPADHVRTLEAIEAALSAAPLPDAGEGMVADAWLIERADGRKEVVLSPLTDDTCLFEGDEAIALFRSEEV